MDREIRVAVVGSGISGMSAAYLLTQGGYKVTVYEKGSYVGGHTNTAQVRHGNKTLNVDTGFIIFTEERYRNLSRLLRELDVSTTESSMSFSYTLNNRDISNTDPSKKRKEIEWGSENLWSIFAQKSNLFKPSFWKMIFDLVRFSREGPKILEDPNKYKSITIREYVTANGYSEGFIDYYLIPVMSSLWSTSFKEIDQFPILTLARFFGNHNMFQLFGRPTWDTVIQGSVSYMSKLAAYIQSHGGQIKLNSGVTQINRSEESDNVEIRDANGTVEFYDHVVVACHPPDAFSFMPDMTEREKKVLSTFKYSYHTVYLHSDPRLMPKRKQVWSSWNYLYDDNSLTDSKVCVTYWMNNLQPWLNKKELDLFVTLNPVVPPQEDKVHKVIQYDHPLYTTESVNSRENLLSIQGTKNTYYAGAYYGHGFHEDGIISGLLAAQALDPNLKKIWNVDLTRYDDIVPKSKNDSNLIKSLTSYSVILLGTSVALYYYKDSVTPLLFNTLSNLRSYIKI